MYLQELNAESFEVLLSKCNRHSNYQGVIVVGTKRDAQSLAYEVANIHRQNRIPGFEEIRHLSQCSILRFMNGSSIEVCDINYIRRGDSYNALLYHNSLDNPYYLEHLARVHRPYRDMDYTPSFWDIGIDTWRPRVVCRNTEEVPEVNEELDNFLNEFKIASVN